VQQKELYKIAYNVMEELLVVKNVMLHLYTHIFQVNLQLVYKIAALKLILIKIILQVLIILIKFLI